MIKSKPIFACSALVFIASVLSASALLAQTGQTLPENSLQAQPIEQDFDITGNLQHPAWQQADPIFIEHELEPDDQASAPVKTSVKVLYSDKNLYIGFVSSDPNPGKIRASISDRDNSFQDDYVGVFLGTFNNNRQAYEFFVNPLGVQMDGLRTGNSEDMNFDALWYSAGAITDSGYTAVMKIPFKSLNYSSSDVQDWSVQFIRNYPRSTRHLLSWTDVSLSNSCLLCQSGSLQNLRGLETSNTVELLPYAMAFQNSEINESQPASGLDNDPIDGRIGGSISYSPNSTLSLDAVVNPDFSQVETDAAQIDVNESFALFYPEKRPFFMRGADLFETDADLFYSRMINNPLAAGKVTQKSDGYSIAYLTAYDRETPFIVPGIYGSSLVRSNENAYSNILRGKYNFGLESFIGGLLTTRNQGDGSNYVGSVDWQLRLADQYYFSGQAGYSATKELTDTTLFNNQRRFGNSRYDAAFNGEQYSGTLLNANFNRRAKYYNFGFSYASYSPTFQSQGGFINQTNRRQFEASQRLSYYPNTAWLSQGDVSVSGTWRYDFSGQFQERFIFLRSSNSFGGQTRLSVSYLPVNDERFRGEYFTDMRRLMIGASTNPIDGLSLGADFDFGRYVNRSSNPTIGEGYNFSANATVKPSSRLQLDFSYNYSKLSPEDGPGTYYSGDVMRLTSRYNFSRSIFARLITEYNSFSDELQLYPLLYYKANPFTKFYIGMTDYMRRFNEGQGFNGFRQTSRRFFVKFQYLIRS